MSQQLLFSIDKPETKKEHLNTPQGYRGFAAFHKYWGKKPIECLCYLVENLTSEREIVLDPFIGSGLIAKETLQRNRRFIGVDVNPIAIDLSKFFVRPPDYEDLSKVLRRMQVDVMPQIDESYVRADGYTATHFLWDGEDLKSVWWGRGRRRQEYEPAVHDIELLRSFSGYKSKHIRDLKFFTNSRINASPQLTVNDLFTGRALRNIDLLLDFIKKQSESIRNTLLLTLTAASGQMSNMVFAVSKRGKMTGQIDERISVGSWVIGYWRPKFHFEINVWNCFQNRARRLMKALEGLDARQGTEFTPDCSDVILSKVDVALVNDDARRVLEDIPPASVSLILTDPPHSDRMPYLELSELWNAILGHKAAFEREIVVSNAKERNKGKERYNREMEQFFINAADVLCDGGVMAILFNAHDSDSWTYLRALQKKSDSIRFRGCFPMSYSARSVVQDNRKGAMKHDFVLIYEKYSGNQAGKKRWGKLEELDGWSSSLPHKDD